MQFSSVYKQMCASPGQENDSFIKLTYLHNTGLVIFSISFMFFNNTNVFSL